MIRYGILGFGLHAVRRLMPGFALATNSRVTALSRRDMKQARASAAEYKIPHAFDSAADLCRSREVDAIFVATPDCWHLKDVLLVIDSGKPVLCEKPMSMNAGECRQMVEAARRAKLLLGVAQVFRFERSAARLRERVAAGQVGRPVFARSEFSYSARTHPRKWLTDAKMAAGGPIADVGVHCIDALRYILSDEVVRLTASGMSDQDSGDVEAAAVLSLEFAGGTLGSILVSARAEYRTPLEIVGETGVLRADDAFSVEQKIEIELSRGGGIVEKEIVSNADAYARQVDTFSAAIEGNGEFPAPGEEGWQNQEVLDAAYRSFDTWKGRISAAHKEEAPRRGVEESHSRHAFARDHWVPRKFSKSRTAWKHSPAAVRGSSGPGLGRESQPTSNRRPGTRKIDLEQARASSVFFN